jgi:hypothetical protein
MLQKLLLQRPQKLQNTLAHHVKMWQIKSNGKPCIMKRVSSRVSANSSVMTGIVLGSELVADYKADQTIM